MNSLICSGFYDDRKANADQEDRTGKDIKRQSAKKPRLQNCCCSKECNSQRRGKSSREERRVEAHPYIRCTQRRLPGIMPSRRYQHTIRV